jgi:hypothetical protein
MSLYPTSIARCQHVKVNGTLCGSPALHRRRYCYFHQQWREKRLRINTRARRRARNLDLPVLEDANSIQITLMQVMRLILTNQIDSKTAGLLLYALQTASVNLRHTDFEPVFHEKVVIDPRNVPTAILDEDLWDPSDFNEAEDEGEEEEASDGEETDENDEEEDEEDETPAVKGASAPAPRLAKDQANLHPKNVQESDDDDTGYTEETIGAALEAFAAVARQKDRERDPGIGAPPKESAELETNKTQPANRPASEPPSAASKTTPRSAIASPTASVDPIKPITTTSDANTTNSSADTRRTEPSTNATALGETTPQPIAEQTAPKLPPPQSASSQPASAESVTLESATPQPPTPESPIPEPANPELATPKLAIAADFTNLPKPPQSVPHDPYAQHPIRAAMRRKPYFKASVARILGLDPNNPFLDTMNPDDLDKLKYRRICHLLGVMSGN